MRWYYNKDGHAQGPLDDEAMAALFHDGDLDADSLIWQSKMGQWQSVRQLNPSWTRPPAVATELRLPPAPATPAPVPSETSPSKPEAKPARHLKPQAPTDPTPQKGGFLKRLFGKKG